MINKVVQHIGLCFDVVQIVQMGHDANADSSEKIEALYSSFLTSLEDLTKQAIENMKQVLNENEQILPTVETANSDFESQLEELNKLIGSFHGKMLAKLPRTYSKGTQNSIKSELEKNQESEIFDLSTSIIVFSVRIN